MPNTFERPLAGSGIGHGGFSTSTGGAAGHLSELWHPGSLQGVALMRGAVSQDPGVKDFVYRSWGAECRYLFGVQGFNTESLNPPCADWMDLEPVRGDAAQSGSHRPGVLVGNAVRHCGLSWGGASGASSDLTLPVGPIGQNSTGALIGWRDGTGASMTSASSTQGLGHTGMATTITTTAPYPLLPGNSCGVAPGFGQPNFSLASQADIVVGGSFQPAEEANQARLEPFEPALNPYAVSMQGTIAAPQTPPKQIGSSSIKTADFSRVATNRTKAGGRAKSKREAPQALATPKSKRQRSQRAAPQPGTGGPQLATGSLGNGVEQGPPRPRPLAEMVSKANLEKLFGCLVIDSHAGPTSDDGSKDSHGAADLQEPPAVSPVADVASADGDAAGGDTLSSGGSNNVRTECPTPSSQASPSPELAPQQIPSSFGDDLGDLYGVSCAEMDDLIQNLISGENIHVTF